MITEDKVIEFFCIMNEFCKKFASSVERKIPIRSSTTILLAPPQGNAACRRG